MMPRLRHILTAHVIPPQIVLVIESFYNNSKCRAGISESSQGVKAGVRHGTMSYVGVDLQPDLTIDLVIRCS